MTKNKDIYTWISGRTKRRVIYYKDSKGIDHYLEYDKNNDWILYRNSYGFERWYSFQQRRINYD